MVGVWNYMRILVSPRTIQQAAPYSSRIFGEYGSISVADLTGAAMSGLHISVCTMRYSFARSWFSLHVSPDVLVYLYYGWASWICRTACPRYPDVGTARHIAEKDPPLLPFFAPIPCLPTGCLRMCAPRNIWLLVLYRL